MSTPQDGPTDSETFPVTTVAGHEPAALDDFVGATTVTVRTADGEHELVGSGARDGAAVHFHERQLASAAEDTSVWEIVAQGEESFSARTPAES